MEPTVKYTMKVWPMLPEGFLGVGVGALIFIAPGIIALGLAHRHCGVELATGVLEIAAAIRLRSEVEGERWLLRTVSLRSSSRRV